ncbi:hypothetical protein D9M69_611580 [compost metagenome]
MRRGVVGHVFHRQPAAQHILCLADTRSDVMHRLLGEREGQQVIEMAIITAIAQVLAVERHVETIQKNPDLLQERHVQRGRAA